MLLHNRMTEIYHDVENRTPHGTFVKSVVKEWCILEIKTAAERPSCGSHSILCQFVVVSVSDFLV